ncbi:unnamed protein product [Polarella glacialis]|uniref:Insulysin n=1 Tax=Polarella glacialis TaxID=89957 RepID=A0A813JAR9_POLGL|nr:unnamed protein product [Polarella glacialis]
MVISDTKCDRAAAALSVKVGSIFDPKEIPGLAHFCEHMLFLGTEKYPNEGDYNEYLAKNGGSSNAYTAETVTNYFFGVKPEAGNVASISSKALDAVCSCEHVSLSMLLRNSANPEHPLHHFMTGNSETLRDRPEKLGIDVRAALLDFHQRYYSANLMRLVIVGREEPEELLAMAMERFAPVVDSGATVPEDAEIGGGVQAFPLEKLARTVYVVPVNDVRSASFQFLLPGQRKLWRSKPTTYLAHLLGHEGRQFVARFSQLQT